MPIINVTNLSLYGKNKQWTKISILKDLNFKIEEKQIFAFIWPNWAWKTSTIKAMLGLHSNYSWKIQINKQHKISYLPDEAAYYPFLTALEHMMFFWKLNKLNKKESKNNGEILLNKLWLNPKNKLKVKNYSKGMKQRLGLAISLINNPKILILDEPMNGLDPIGRKIVKEILIEQKKNWNTIFFSTHILSDVEEIADNFAIIHHWQIKSQQKVSTLIIPLEDFFLKKIHH